MAGRPLNNRVAGGAAAMLTRGCFRRLGPWVILLTATLLSTPAWSGTTPQFRFFPVGTDLGSPSTKDIETDREGFVWLVTDGGLYRYDGIDLTLMTPEIDGQPVDISRIEIDQDDGLWAMTEDQFIFRDPHTGNWSKIIEIPPEEMGIWDFAVDSSGSIWMATSGQGMVHLDPASASYVAYEAGWLPNRPPIKVFYCLLIDSAGRLWAGSMFGLHLYDPEANSFRYYHNPAASSGPNGNPDIVSEVNQIAEASDGTILLATEQGPLRFHPGPDRFSAAGVLDQTQNPVVALILEPDADRLYPGYERFEHFPGWADRFSRGPGDLWQRALSIAEGPSGRIWVGIDGRGLDVFDPPTGEWLNIPAHPDDVFGLIDDFVADIHVDDQGLIWFATRTGVNRLDPRSGRFKAWPFNPDRSYGPNTTVPNALFEDSKGTLWVASQAGLEALDSGSDEWVLYRQFPTDQQGHSYNWVLGLAEDSEGRFWVGTGGRINLFDRSTREFSNSIETWPFLFLHDDRQGHLLAGYDLSAGVGLFDPTAKFSRRLDGSKMDMDFLPSPSQAEFFQPYSAFEDSKARHWIATSDGLKQWHPDTETLTNVEFGMTEPRWVARVLEAEDGRLWLATEQGLKLLDPDALTLASEEGLVLPTDTIQEMTQDNRRRLWMATPKGLLLFDPATGYRRLYRREDGLPGNRINVRHLVARRNGNIVVATDRGLVTFDPEKFPQPKTGPPVAISELNVDDRKLVPGIFGPANPLVLTYRDILLKIDFAALDLSHPEQNHYRYRLAGLGEQWEDAEADQAFATYTTLPPGQYRFEVAAANSDGIWNEAELSLPIEVLPPPWRTGWAYAIYVIGMALSVVLLVAFRTRQLRDRSRHLEATVTARTHEIEIQKQTIAGQASRLEKLLATKNRLFADISHEFRTPLTLIAGPVEEAYARTEDDDLADELTMAKHSVSRLTRLVDQLLDLARLDAGQVVSRAPQPLSAIVVSQIKAFQSLAEARGTELLEGEIENCWVACGSDALEKILANLISNAIKFTPHGGQVIVSVHSVGSHVCLEVSDTGVGIPIEMQSAVFERFNRGVIQGETVSGAGIGLALVRELVEACDGHVDLDSSCGKGTTVSVYLPEASGPTSLLDPTLQPGSALRQEVDVLGAVGGVATERSGSAESEQILIIEDSVDLRHYLPSVLGQRYSYTTAADGETGLAEALESIPDLLICDAMLPGMDGFTVCEKVKTDLRTSHIPVLMLTARADDASRLKGYEHHADDYLTKPFSGDELRVRCRNLLESRRIMRQRFSRQLFVSDRPALELSLPDQTFLEKLESRVDKGYPDPEFSAASLARMMAMSLRQLQRKTKAVVDHSPAEYIRNYRLVMARKRIEAGESVTQACFTVGFTSQSYFSRCFKAYFGIIPSDTARSPKRSDD